MPKTMNKREALIGLEKRAKATLSTEIKDDGTLTFIMVSSDNGGLRRDWGTGEPYLEVLDVSGADTSNLNTFFKDHNRGVDDAIGSIQNKREDSGQLLADVLFDKDGLSIKRKYENKTLNDVSIGYEVLDYKVEEREGDIDLVTITKYKIVELSAVGVGFDSNAKHIGRNSQTKTGENEMNEELKQRLLDLEAMTKRNAEESKEMKSLIAQREADTLATERAEMQRVKAENAELVRKAEINTIAVSYGASDELRAKFDDKGNGAEFMKAILDERKAEQPHIEHAQPKDDSTRESMINAMSDSIALNRGIVLADAHEDAGMFRQASIMDMMRKLTGYSGFDKNELAKRSLVSADLPLLLTNSGNRMMASSFDLSGATFDQFTSAVDVQDFRSITDVSASSGQFFEKTPEGGESKERQGVESGETYEIDSYSGELIVTRKMLINDDLNALLAMFDNVGHQGSMLINTHVYDLLQKQGDYANYTMADGKDIFHNDHKNSGSAALSPESIAAGYAKMFAQKDASGNPLNINPAHLIVGIDNALLADQILKSTASLEDSKNSGVVNPINSLGLGRVLDGNIAADGWFLMSGRKTIKVAYLAGTGRRPLTETTQDLNGLKIKAVLDFGVMAEDYRSMYKGK